MEALKKVLNIVIDIFIVLVVIISAIIAIISLSSKSSGVANLFGYVPFSVQTDSMSPAFQAGDLIVSNRVDGFDKDKDFEFREGDVITYWTLIEDANGQRQTVLNTHRIIKIYPSTKRAYFKYETKGDNNDLTDKELVGQPDIVALWSRDGESGIRIEKLGSVLDFLRKPSGFFISVIIPMAIFFIYELVRFITNFMNYNKQKAKEAALEAAKELMGNSSSDSSGLSEEQKAQAILEFLEKQQAEQAAAPQAEESPKAEETEQPATEEETVAVTEPEQEEEVSEASED